MTGAAQRRACWFLAALACCTTVTVRAAGPYTSVPTFYSAIRQAARSAGYQGLPAAATASATYQTVVCSYFWGFPLQETYRAQNNSFATYGYAVNQLFAPGVLNTGTTVVAPNLNVLNATGFLDLSGNNAFVISVPATSTYNVMQILDAYTNVTQSVGTRNWSTGATSTAGGNYLVTGPSFDPATIPAGLTFSGTIQNPTNQAWLIGRVAVDPYASGNLGDGAATPYSTVAGGAVNPLSLTQSRAIVQSYGLTPLATYAAGTITGPVTSSTPGPSAYASVPTGTTFYEWLGANVALNGVPGTSGVSGTGQMAMFQNFQSIGLTTGGFTTPADPATVSTIDSASQDALAALAAIGANVAVVAPNSITSTNWAVNTSLGNYQATYSGWIGAAAVAAVGLGANVAADGVYPQTTRSGAGATLDGDTVYEISFPANGTGVGMPPARAFWSLTVYDTNGNIVPNTGNTFYGDNVYSLSSMQMANVLGAGYGSTPFSILLSSSAPSDPSLMPFWLPTPANADYEVIMRIYDPADASAASSILVANTAANYSLVPAITAVPEPVATGLVATLLAIAAGASRLRRR